MLRNISSVIPSHFFIKNIKCVSMTCSDRLSFSWKLLPDDNGAGKEECSGLLDVHVRWTGRAAAWIRAGKITCLPVWGPQGTADPWLLPHLQEDQPGWWKVSVSTRCKAKSCGTNAITPTHQFTCQPSTGFNPVKTLCPSHRYEKINNFFTLR